MYIHTLCPHVLEIIATGFYHIYHHVVMVNISAQWVFGRLGTRVTSYTS